MVPQAVILSNDNGDNLKCCTDQPSTSRDKTSRPDKAPVPGTSGSGTSGGKSSNTTNAGDQTNVTYEAEELDDSDYDDEQISKSRFNWKISTTRLLLNTLVDRKKSSKEFILTKKVWPETAQEMRKNPVTGGHPNSIQCREKFYSLKRGYRKFLTESKKTGNKRPRPFLFEDDMQLLLEDDPAFKPLLLRSSFGTKEVNNNLQYANDVNEDTDEETDKLSTCSTTSSSTTSVNKTKRSKTDELKDYFTQRDEKFMSFMREMQDKNNSVLEKLIEKL